jgi:hypothetical protein
MHTQLTQIIAREHLADMHRAAARQRLVTATDVPRRLLRRTPRAGALRARVTARIVLTRP